MVEEPDIIGDWERERVLGCGGFGIVVLWKNSKNNDRIAIKKYRGENASLSPKHKDRWTQEVEMMKRINNVNIVCFRNLPPELDKELNKFNPCKLPMLSMEFCTKGDLRNMLARSENCCGLSESDVRYILSDLMNAVSYLHNMNPNITHRDLKPENIVLQSCDRENGIIYKLIDLGYAKELDTKSICASFVGTLQYLAPELLYSKTYSCSVDYWSMGLVAFEIMCGTRPFLPNMSPAQWMYHVRKKSSEIICIYQENELLESIKYSEDIFQECRISLCFKREMEKWLRLALEYIPRKRGYINYEPDSTTNELAIFTSLKTLLDKKVITTFSVYTREFCSYEIDDFTRVDTLQGWIERDTKITKLNQQLLSTDCDVIEPDELAVKYFDTTYRHPTIFVFHKSEMLHSDMTIKNTPESVKKMLNNSSILLPYHFQKRAYSHALHFIRNENVLHNSLLDACAHKIRHMLKTCNTTTNLCRNLFTHIEKMKAQKDFSRTILEYDCKQYLKNYSQNANHWTNSFNAIAELSERLDGVCKQLVLRQESAARRTGTLNNAFIKELSSDKDHALKLLMDEATSCYQVVRNRSKDKRNTPEDCKKMTKIVYNVLKSRDKLLRDTNFLRYLQMIMDIENELEKMIPPLNSAMEHSEKYQKDFLTDHMTRQRKIWEFTIKQKSKSSNTESPVPENSGPKTNFLLGNPQTPKDDYGTPVSLEKPLHFILGEGKHASIESNSSYHSTCGSPIPPKVCNDSLINTNIANSILINNKNSLEINKNCSSSLPASNYLQPELPTKNAQRSLEIQRNDVSSSSLSTNDVQAPNNFNAHTNETATFDFTRNNGRVSNVPTACVPNFSIGKPASYMIDINTSLRYEIQEKTNESFLKCKSILSEKFDFSFLEEENGEV